MANSIISKSIITRPSKDIRWGTDDGSQANYFKRIYLDTGKVLSRSISVSEDLLTRTVITVWASEDERIAYNNDPVVQSHLKEQTEYRLTYNLTHRWVNQEIGPNNEIIRTWEGGHFFESN